MMAYNNSSTSLPPDTICEEWDTMALMYAFLTLSAVMCAVLLVSCRNITKYKEERHSARRQRRPIIIDVSLILCLVFWMLYSFREFQVLPQVKPFVEGLVLFITYDVCLFLYLCYDGYSFFNTASDCGVFIENNNSFIAYCIFFGFPLGSATKLLVIAWLFDLVSAWIILVPVAFGLWLCGIVLPSIVVYKAICLYKKTIEVKKSDIFKLSSLFVSAVLLWLWFASVITMQGFVSTRENELICWTPQLWPVLLICPVAILTSSIHPLRKGSGNILRYLPELVLFWALSAFTVPLSSWLHERRETTYKGDSSTLNYAVGALFMCALHQVMHFLLHLRRQQISDHAENNGSNSHSVSVSVASFNSTGAPVIIHITPPSSPQEDQSAQKEKVIKKLRGVNPINVRNHISKNITNNIGSRSLDEDICSICLEGYSTDSEDVNVAYIKQCGHVHHFNCVWQWLEKNNNCPLCREDVAVNSDDMILFTLSELREVYENAHIYEEISSNIFDELQDEHFLQLYETREQSIESDSFQCTMTIPETSRRFHESCPVPYQRDECSICMESLASPDTSPVYFIANCNHAFHRDCISYWITVYKICPNCPIGDSFITEDDFRISLCSSTEV